MKAALFLLQLLTAIPAIAGAPRFAPTPEGEVAVDLELDLNQLPSFPWAADPFLQSSGLGRGARLQQEGETFQLQATTVEGEDSIAVVNDRVVRVGDRVGSRTVLKIGPDFVLLGLKGSVIEATLEPPAPAEAARAPASSSEPAPQPAPSANPGSASASGSSPVPAGLRLSPDNKAVKAGEMLDKLLDGKISIEEVKK